MTRFLLAPARAFVLVLLAVVGSAVALVLVTLLALIVTYPMTVVVARRLAELGRRLAQAWGGVAIDKVRLPVPARPVRRADGWYEHGNQLYRSHRVPAFMLKVEAYSKDATAIRDWIWLAATPVTGGLAAAFSPFLVVTGVAMAAGRLAPGLPAAAAVAVGVAAVLAGFAVGPVVLRVYGLWTRELLQPAHRSWWRRSGLGPWIGRATKQTWNGAGLAGMALGALGFLPLQLVFTVVSWGGLYPQAVQITRPYLDFYRRRAAEWTGRDYPQPYRPLPAPPRPDETGKYRAGRTLYQTREAAERAQRYGWVFTDPATWRDLLWIVLGVPMSVVGFLPAILVGFGLYGLVWQPIVWAPWGIPVGLATGEWVTPWYMGYVLAVVAPSLAAIPGWVTPFIGVAMTAAGLLLAGPLLRLRRAFDHLLLTPTQSTLLAQRVRRLTETRADAVDAQAAELRRIERDLHDGAQARLVSVGLSLATVEQLIEIDPSAAKKLLAQARETSATALAELRDLVRGIHPPVLAERGLGDAVRAVALDTPLPVDVTVDLPGRPPAPVESAAYFATVEALANAARHSGAARVAIDIRYGAAAGATGAGATGAASAAGAGGAGVLRITVTDDGRGGADPARGTGLRGVQRRLGTFDGTLSIESPAGGPTVLTMEIPCELSSPRTSTS